MQDLIFNTHDVVLLATIYQSLLFALLILMVPRERHKADAFLIGFLIIIPIGGASENWQS